LADASALRAAAELGTLATQSANISDYLTSASAALSYQPLDSDLTSIAALTTTAFGRSMLSLTDASALQAAAGLGTLATQNANIADYLTSAAAASAYQPLDGDLTSLAGQTGTNTVVYRSAANTWSPVTFGAGLSFAGGTLTATSAGGTVSSVALSMPADFSVAGSPVTSAGTLAVTYANQSANRVFAGPLSGDPGAPSFRALGAADIPDLSSTYEAANVNLGAIAALVPAVTAKYLALSSGPSATLTRPANGEAVYLSGDITTNSAVMSDAGNLAVTLSAGKTYFVFFIGGYSTSVTTEGMRLTLSGSQSADNITFLTFIQNNFTAITSTLFCTSYNQVSAVAVNGPGPTATVSAMIFGVIKNGANDSVVKVRFATETTGTSTLRLNSVLLAVPANSL